MFGRLPHCSHRLLPLGLEGFADSRRAFPHDTLVRACGLVVFCSPADCLYGMPSGPAVFSVPVTLRQVLVSAVNYWEGKGSRAGPIS